MTAAGSTQLGIMQWSSYITSSVLIVLLTKTLLNVWNGSRVGFLLAVVSMLIISNAAFICYIAVYNDRKNIVQNQDATRQEELPLVTFSVACDFVRYLTLQVSMWLFTFKYWVVSVELPKAIQRIQSNNDLRDQQR